MDKERLEQNRPLIAIQVVALKKFTNIELAVFNNALRTSGRVLPQHLCYQAALAANLIKENGEPGFDLDLCRYALDHEINRRVEAGTFS